MLIFEKMAKEKNITFQLQIIFGRAKTNPFWIKNAKIALKSSLGTTLGFDFIF